MWCILYHLFFLNINIYSYCSLCFSCHCTFSILDWYSACAPLAFILFQRVDELLGAINDQKTLLHKAEKNCAKQERKIQILEDRIAESENEVNT